MNEILEQKLASALEAAEGAGKDIYNFILEQSPELANDIINWGIYYNGIVSTLSLIAFVLVVGLAFFTSYKVKNDRKWENLFDDSGSGILTTIFTVLLVIIGSTVSFACFMEGVGDFIQALVAPRLYLLEYLKELL